MTMPDERYRAIKYLREASALIFTRGKGRPSLTELRHIFRSALRHYPSNFDLEQIADCPRCKKILEKAK